MPANPAEAVNAQNELRHKVRLDSDFRSLKIIAGVDCSFPAQDVSRAVIVAMDAETLQPIETATADAPTLFPYIPGFLSFREIPVILDAFKKLKSKPDLFMVDGQGIAHPRRLGIAAHLGVLLDAPCIGVAKSRLCGTHKVVPPAKGSAITLTDKNERIGTVLRSKENCLPLYISPGHRVSHEDAVQITLRCLTKYRLPEPTRIADKISKMKEAPREGRSQTELSFG